MPSTDVAADVRHFTSMLGAAVVFAVEGMGARVALLRIADGPPRVLLADHLEGERPILVYRVASLKKAVADLKANKAKKLQELELPMGRCASFRTANGHRFAVFELTRPQVLEHFKGRRDF